MNPKKDIIVAVIIYAAVFVLGYFVIKHLIYLNKVTKATSEPVNIAKV